MRKERQIFPNHSVPTPRFALITSQKQSDRLASAAFREGSSYCFSLMPLQLYLLKPGKLDTLGSTVLAKVHQSFQSKRFIFCICRFSVKTTIETLSISLILAIQTVRRNIFNSIN
jgi:hypothetical protein